MDTFSLEKEYDTVYEEIEVEVPYEVEYQETVYEEIYEPQEINIQFGANTAQTLQIKLPHIDCEALDILDVAGNPSEKAILSLGKMKGVLDRVNSERSRMGAYTNGLVHLISAEDIATENIMSAESLIRDTNLAEEMSEFARTSILENASLAMLAQANKNPQGVLELLK